MHCGVHPGHFFNCPLPLRWTVMLLSLLLSLAPQQPLAPAAANELLPRATSLGFLPRGLTSFGAAASGGWLYVLGGYHGAPHDYSVEGQSTAFLQINLRDTRDLRMLSDVEPVQGAELVGWRGKLIRVGGLHARNVYGDPSDLHSSDEVALFDPATGEWSALPSLPARRSSHRAVVAGDVLFVVGGWMLSGSSRTGVWADTLLSLDLSDTSRGWSAEEAPFQRRALGAAATGDDVIVVGGIGPDRSISSGVWRRDGATGEWSQGPEFPDWGFGVAAANDEDQILVSGRTGTIFCLEPEAHSWRPVGALQQARFFHELVHDASAGLVALGGITGMEARGRVRPIECLSAQPLSPRVERFQLPAPVGAAGSGGFLADGRSVYFAGREHASVGEGEDAAELWRLDLPGLAWRRLADLPARVQDAAFTRYGGESLALLAGSTAGPKATASPASFVYDLEFDDWTPGPAMDCGRAGFQMVEHGDALWLFGGSVLAQGRSGDPAGVRPDGLSVDRWVAAEERFLPSGAQLPGPRSDFAGALIGERYYLVGGAGADGGALGDALCFDFSTSSWIACASPRSARVGAQLVPVGDAAFLVGGRLDIGPDGAFSSAVSVERFDPVTGEWSEVIGDLGTGDREVVAFEVGGRLHVIALGARAVEVLNIHVD